MHALFLEGARRQEVEKTYFAVRYLCNVDDTKLPLSVSARKGLRMSTSVSSRDPTTYEATLLTASCLLEDLRHPALIRVLFPCWLLLTFDLYPRPGDWSPITVRDVLRPQLAIGDAAANFAVTFWPLAQSRTSKTNTQDDTIVVGPRLQRPHLATMMQALVDGRDPTSPLFPNFKAFLGLCRSASKQAGVPSFTAHQLRHGGASHNGLVGLDLHTIQ